MAENEPSKKNAFQMLQSGFGKRKSKGKAKGASKKPKVAYWGVSSEVWWDSSRSNLTQLAEASLRDVFCSHSTCKARDILSRDDFVELFGKTNPGTTLPEATWKMVRDSKRGMSMGQFLSQYAAVFEDDSTKEGLENLHGDLGKLGYSYRSVNEDGSTKHVVLNAAAKVVAEYRIDAALLSTNPLFLSRSEKKRRAKMLADKSSAAKLRDESRKRDAEARAMYRSSPGRGGTFFTRIMAKALRTKSLCHDPKKKAWAMTDFPLAQHQLSDNSLSSLRWQDLHLDLGISCSSTLCSTAQSTLCSSTVSCFVGQKRIAAVPFEDVKVEPVSAAHVSNVLQFARGSDARHVLEEMHAYFGEETGQTFAASCKMLSRAAHQRYTHVAPVLPAQQQLCKQDLLTSAVDMAWTTKYAPRCGSQVIGNAKAVAGISQFLTSLAEASWANLEWEDEDEDDFQNMALVTGPTGCGKTSAIYACAAELGYEIIEINAEKARTRSSILSLFGEATQSHRFDLQQNPPERRRAKKKRRKNAKKEVSKKTLILFEEVDEAHALGDGSVFAALRTLRRTSKRPILLTANHMTDALRSLGLCSHFVLERPPPSTCAIYLQCVCMAEGFKLEPEELHLIAKRFDLRAALNWLQFWMQTYYPPISPKGGRAQVVMVPQPRRLTAAHGGFTYLTVSEFLRESSRERSRKQRVRKQRFEIESVSPCAALAAGGSSITVFGRHFPRSARRCEVRIGGVACLDVDVIDDTCIRARVPRCPNARKHGWPQQVSVDFAGQGAKKDAQFAWLSDEIHSSRRRTFMRKVVMEGSSADSLSFRVRGGKKNKFVEVTASRLDEVPVGTLILSVAGVPLRARDAASVHAVLDGFPLREGVMFTMCVVEKTVVPRPEPRVTPVRIPLDLRFFVFSGGIVRGKVQSRHESESESESDSECVAEEETSGGEDLAIAADAMSTGDILDAVDAEIDDGTMDLRREICADVGSWICAAATAFAGTAFAGNDSERITLMLGRITEADAFSVVPEDVFPRALASPLAATDVAAFLRSICSAEDQGNHVNRRRRRRLHPLDRIAGIGGYFNEARRLRLATGIGCSKK
eukprot:g4936.t1